MPTHQQLSGRFIEERSGKAGMSALKADTVMDVTSPYYVHETRCMAAVPMTFLVYDLGAGKRQGASPKICTGKLPRHAAGQAGKGVDSLHYPCSGLLLRYVPMTLTGIVSRGISMP